MTTCGLEQHLSDVDALALLVAAAVHDFQHPGVNNQFMIRVQHPLALLYNDNSVRSAAGARPRLPGLTLHLRWFLPCRCGWWGAGAGEPPRGCRRIGDPAPQLPGCRA